MSETKKRNTHLPEFKAKVGLEAERGVKTVNQIAQEFGVHPVQVGQWKREIQAHGNQTPDSVHTSSTGGGAMIVEKYGTKPEPEGHPIALCSTATAFGQVGIENRSALQNAKNWGSAVQLCEIGCNLNYRQLCLDDGVHFRHVPFGGGLFRASLDLIFKELICRI